MNPDEDAGERWLPVHTIETIVRRTLTQIIKFPFDTILS